MQNLIYKIKYLLFLSWVGEVGCLTQPGGGGNTPPPPLPRKKNCLKQGAEIFSLPRGAK
jgi:hypothetical protein